MMPMVDTLRQFPALSNRLPWRLTVAAEGIWEEGAHPLPLSSTSQSLINPYKAPVSKTGLGLSP
jgi:hypothetical protein